MRALIQRVSRASVSVNSSIVGQIERGLLIFLAIRQDDTEAEASRLLKKLLELRIFNDEDGKMNRNVAQICGGLLIISQFTLYGDARKGNRPSYIKAAPIVDAKRNYEYFVNLARTHHTPVTSGVFQAHMEVNLTNDGPVTILLDVDRAD